MSKTMKSEKNHFPHHRLGLLTYVCEICISPNENVGSLGRKIKIQVQEKLSAAWPKSPVILTSVWAQIAPPAVRLLGKCPATSAWESVRAAWHSEGFSIILTRADRNTLSGECIKAMQYLGCSKIRNMHYMWPGCQIKFKERCLRNQLGNEEKHKGSSRAD